MFGELTRDDVFRIETRRLWLRWPRASDAAAIAAFASLREVAQMTARVPHPYPPGAAALFIAQTQATNAAGAGLDLVITEKRGAREPVGCVGLASEDGKLSLGFIVAPAHWGKGYASEAARVMINAAFLLTQTPAVTSCVFAGNPASTRVHAKCGFVSLGPCRLDVPLRGRIVEVERFSLSRKLWASDRPGVRHSESASCAV